MHASSRQLCGFGQIHVDFKGKIEVENFFNFRSAQLCGRIFKKFSHVKFLFENRLIFADLRQQSSGSPDQPPSECHTKRKHKTHVRLV